MATVMICILILLIAIFGIKSYCKKLSSGCCGASGGKSVKKNKVKDRDPSHYPLKRILYIDGMTCGNCVNRVENALNELEGVWATADLMEGKAVVRMKQDIPLEELKQAVKSAGYLVYKSVVEKNSQ